jgi:hypothetical protein
VATVYASQEAYFKAREARRRRREGRKKKEMVVKGVAREGPMYTVAVEISTDAQSWSSPLTAAKPDKYYYIRTTITQHVGQPMIQGFKLDWTKPSDWLWVDGLGRYSYEESISNPIQVVRKVKSPLVLSTVKFSTAVADYYR